MTSEGTFPKVDGDIFYASEANRFAKASEYMVIGSTPLVASGTDYQSLGSIFISGGSLPIPFMLDIRYSTTGGHNGIKLIISGTDNNASVNPTDGAGPDINSSAMATLAAGSPFSTSISILEGLATATLKYGIGGLGYFNTGSNFIIEFQVRATQPNTGLRYYSIQKFRGAM